MSNQQPKVPGEKGCSADQISNAQIHKLMDRYNRDRKAVAKALRISPATLSKNIIWKRAELEQYRTADLNKWKYL